MKSWLVRLARNEHAIMSLVVLISFGVYQTTRCPTVSFTDSGELATVATTLGIAHPTGYPLWTLISRIATILPIGDEPIVRLNVFSGILTSLAVGLFFRIILTMYRARRVFQYEAVKGQQPPDWLPLLAAFATALIVGFSSTVWSQSVEIEVYALHLLLLIAATLSFVSGIEEQLRTSDSISHKLFLFSFILGLSFANHMTTVLLAPGFLYLYFRSLGSNKRSWRIILLLTPCFLLGLSAYVYLPIRSAAGPAMDWGHPASLQRLWWQVTGKQYQTWMFAGWDVAKKQLQYFFSNFPTEFQWAIVIVLLYSVIELFHVSKRLLAFLVILFATCLVYTINYDINEIDPYFLLAYVACGAILGVGLIRLLNWSWRQRVYLKVTIAVLILLLPVAQVLSNREDVDESRNYQAEDFVKNVFADLEPNAVVFSSLWDYFVSPSFYYQIVRNDRPDVVLVDYALLQDRTWYFSQFARQHPGILEPSQLQVDGFLQELAKFEQGEAFDYATIKARWDALLGNLVDNLITDHPVYVDPRIAANFPQDFEAVPQGLLVRLVKKGEPIRWKPIVPLQRKGSFANYVTSDLKAYFATMYTYHAYWLSSKGDTADARVALNEALGIEPTFIPALRLRPQLSR